MFRTRLTPKLYALPNHSAQRGADNPIQDKQEFMQNERVRVREPRSANIWLVDTAILRGKHWKYVLKNPDNEKQVYNGGEEVEETRLRAAG